MKSVSLELDEATRRAIDAVIDAALRGSGAQALPPVDHLRVAISRAMSAAAKAAADAIDPINPS